MEARVHFRQFDPTVHPAKCFRLKKTVERLVK